MCLYRVIKSDSVVFSDVIYTLKADTTEIEDKAEVEKTLDENDTQLAKANNDHSQKQVFIDEDAIWQRLQKMLEDEREIVLDKANKEASDIRMRAQQEGLNKGTTERASEIEKLICRIDDTLNRMRAEIDSRLNGYEKSLTMLTADIASKVLNEKIEQNDLALVGLVRSAIEEYKNSEWISVTLSDSLKGSLTEIERILKQDVVNGRLDVVSKEAPKGTCIVETSDGIVDASVGVQIENLKDMLKHIQTDDG